MNSRVLPILALLIAIGIFFAYVNPTWSGPIAAMKTAIASDDEALAAAKEYTEQQNELASARNAINPDDLKRLEVFLPDSVDNVGLILDLNTLASNSGLLLSNVDVVTNTVNSPTASAGVPSAAVNPIHSVDLTLSAVGTYTAFKEFLQGVEKSERLLDIRDLSVKGSSNGVYTYQMKLRLYWLK